MHPSPGLHAVLTCRGLQSAERSLIMSLAFCKTSGSAGESGLGFAAAGGGPDRDRELLRATGATFQ